MAEISAISWCDGTMNPWVGCSKVSPACDHCYAERDNGRRKWVEGWGPGIARHRTSAAYWKQPLKWNRTALAKYGRPMRVFCASLADVFDNEAPQDWREDLWALIRYTPNLRWILLTKRIGNAPRMLPRMGLPPNAGIMATLENQDVWDRDYPKLMAIPAAWRGVSAEPLLGPIDMTSMMAKHGQVDWMITGGESGSGHRPLDVDAVRSIRDQCSYFGVTFHHKQNGGITGKAAGCLVDGVEHKAFPEALL